MSVRNIFILILAIFIGLSCSKDNPVQSESGNSDIQMVINFDPAAAKIVQLGKSATITSVKLTVTGPGMDDVTKNLTLNSETTSASGTIDVPKGNNRTFSVQGIDGNSVVQFNGEATQNITNDSETVELTAWWTPPDPVTLTVTSVTATTAHLSWNTSSETDFSFYRVLVSTTPTLDPELDQVGDDLTSRSSTSMTVTNLTANTTYYAAVISVDTELWFYTGLDHNQSGTIVKKFKTTSSTQNVDISYDDNNFEMYFVATIQDEILAVHFSSPSYPVKVVGINLNIRGTDNFTVVINDYATNNFIGGGTASGSDDFNFGWINYDLEPLDINVTDDFFAGIKYSGTMRPDNTWGPGLSQDNTSSAGRSYDMVPGFDPLLFDDAGWPGNLGVRVTVEISGGSTQTIVLKPEPRKSGAPFGALAR